jgi:hypothetical protein
MTPQAPPPPAETEVTYETRREWRRVEEPLQGWIFLRTSDCPSTGEWDRYELWSEPEHLFPTWTDWIAKRQLKWIKTEPVDYRRSVGPWEIVAGGAAGVREAGR